MMLLNAMLHNKMTMPQYFRLAFIQVWNEKYHQVSRLLDTRYSNTYSRINFVHDNKKSNNNNKNNNNDEVN